MPFPRAWVDRLFEKLTLTYGASFLRQYEGIPLEDDPDTKAVGVKSNWALELDGFEHHAESIVYALQHLPPAKAPTVLEFRELCRRAPPPPQPLLEAPKADPERVATSVATLRQLAPGRRGPEGGRGWAYKLQERQRAGMVLTKFQRDCLRQALASDGVVEQEVA